MTFTALSVIQPWPWLLLRPDVVDAAARAELQASRQIKDCENREWETPVRGWVLLHASSSRVAKWDWRAAVLFAAKRGVEMPLAGWPRGLTYGAEPLGAVVGAIRVDDCRRAFPSPWHVVGQNAFVIGAAVPFAAPVECDGKPKFFQLPQPGSGLGGDELADRLARAICAAGLAKHFKLEEEIS